MRNDDPLSPYYRVGNAWSPSMTEADLTLKAADPNFRMVDIAPFVESGQRRYAAVWIDNTGPQHFEYKLILHTTPGDFQAQAEAVDATAKFGWRVIDVEAMPVPGGGAGQFEAQRRRGPERRRCEQTPAVVRLRAARR